MDYDLIVVGAGPAGYVAAIRAGQVGLKTALVERGAVGGMCLNWGCMPTKSLLESVRLLQQARQAGKFGVRGIDPAALSLDWAAAVARAGQVVNKLARGIDFLLKKNGVERIAGEATVTAGGVRVAERSLSAGNTLLATGSRPRPLPETVPAEVALEIPALLALSELPPALVVAGSGGAAVELAQLLRLAGAEVTLWSDGDSLLPGFDPFLEAFARHRLEKDGVVLTGDPFEGVEGGMMRAGGKVFRCDRLVNARSRLGVIPPSEVPLPVEAGFLRTDDALRVLPGIWAAGDVNGRSNLAHAASAQGLAVVNGLRGREVTLAPHLWPLNVYTLPELAQIGRTEPDLRSRGIEFRVSAFPLSANGKAQAEGHGEGTVRILSEPRYGEILGVQIVAPHATDMIAEAAALMRLEATVDEVTSIVHAHPTVSEVFLEAGFAAAGEPVHG